MPYMAVITSAPVAEEKKKDILSRMSKIIAESIGKPEKYVMVTLHRGSAMMGGEEWPAAFADVRSIGGLGEDVNPDITRKLCDLLHESLGIASDRVYVTFSDISASHWGWNGATFG